MHIHIIYIYICIYICIWLYSFDIIIYIYIYIYIYIPTYLLTLRKRIRPAGRPLPPGGARASAAPRRPAILDRSKARALGV